MMTRSTSTMDKLKPQLAHSKMLNRYLKEKEIIYFLSWKLYMFKQK